MTAKKTKAAAAKAIPAKAKTANATPTRTVTAAAHAGVTAAAIVAELRPLGKESYKKVLLNHGVKEPFFGVSIEEMKKIQKRVKTDDRLALDLYETGIHDAMCLAGLIADDRAMTRKDLQHWLDKESNGMLGEYTVPWVAAGSNHGRELALEWIDSKKETVAAAAQDRGEVWRGHRRHGQHRLQGPRGGGTHQEGRAARLSRQEAQIGQMLT